MKFFFFILIALLNFQLVLAQIFDVEAIQISGDNDKRINLVILSEGYQLAELTQFIADATNFTNDMFSQSPFSEYADYFNVYAIKVPSNESGADHPGNGLLADETNFPIPINAVDTYFNATYDSFGFHRLLYYEIDGNNANNTKTKINTVLANNFPSYDQALILVNSPYYGGSGGEFPMASRGSINGVSANEIAIHELGHSLFNLKDEYYPLQDVFFGEAINMTQETNPTSVKWKNWIGTNGIGIYQYNNTGIAASWYRPHQNCKMRYLNVPFCSVCKEGMIEKIHSLVTPINSFMPVSNTIDSPSFPLDFQLNLIKPDPNTLESEWTLNSSSFVTNMDGISIEETDLNTGINTLTAVVNDNASLLKVDNHETIHLYTVTWTINKTTLGIEDIKSEVNNLSISMYPNPVNTILNLKVESEKDTNLKVEIVSINGKKIKTMTLSNFQTNSIDISDLNSGIYLTNFYSNQILISSKKLVKN